MIGKDYENSVEMHIDAFKEIGNMGAAHAATALSKFVKKDFFIDVTDTTIMKITDIPSEIKSISGKVATVYMDVRKDQRANVLMVFPYEQATSLSNLFFGQENNLSRELTEDDNELLLEVGNICICAYLNAVSKLVDTVLWPSPPGVAVDRLEPILQLPVCVLGDELDIAVAIETKFIQKRLKH